MDKLVAVEFPGGKRITAEIGGRTVHTDQPVKDGGEGSAPSPFDLFLASIAACAGYYALAFCEKRGLGAAGMSLAMRCPFDAAARRYSRLEIELTLPAGFPEKYEAAVLKAMQACYVTKHIADPPEFVLTAKRP